MPGLRTLGAAASGLVGGISNMNAQADAEKDRQEQLRRQALMQMGQNLQAGQLGGPAVAEPKPEGANPLSVVGDVASGVVGGVLDEKAAKRRGEPEEDQFLQMARGYLGR